MNRQAHFQTGFTLIELMIGIAVLGILMTAAVPALQDYLLNSRLTARTNSLVASFNYARSQAISLGRPINVTAWVPGDTKDNWSRGWEIWTDNGLSECIAEGDADDDDGALTESCEILKSIRLVGAVDDPEPKTGIIGPDDLATQSNAALATAEKAATLSFRVNGTVNLLGATPVDFFICDNRTGEKGRRIRLLHTGRVVLQDREYNCD